MPLKYFLCPDGNKISTAMCLENCRMGKRCLTFSTLKQLAENRPPLPNPSVTELLNGPRIEWLKRKYDYSESPDDMAFRFLGTKAHESLELAAHDMGVNEERLFNEYTTGRFDNLEYEDGKHWTLTDYKTYGSYAVKKMLEEGNEELELQLNMLRLLIEKQDPPIKVNGNPVMHIEKLYVQVIVRDGGTYMAKKNGIPWKMRRLEVGKLPDNIVEGYFRRRREELLDAIKHDQIPRLCTEKESWEGKRCAEYCQVKEWCVKNGDNVYVK